MLTIFRPKSRKLVDQKFENFSRQLVQAFAQIKTDINELSSKLDGQQSELERIGQWVSYLHRTGQRMSDSHSFLSKKQEKITENHRNLHSSHQDLMSRHAELAENLEKRHKELSEQLSAQKSVMREALSEHLDGHKELTKREMDNMRNWISHISSGIERQGEKSESLKQEIALAHSKREEGHDSLRRVLETMRAENDSLKQSLAEMAKTIQETRDGMFESQNLARSQTQALKSELKSELRSEILDKVDSQLEKVRTQAPMQVPVTPQVHHQVQQTIAPSAHTQVFPSSGFERHIMSRVMPNRKSYVLRFITDLASENRFSTKEIEEIVVKEKRLCGRTSFYAYLKELKYRGRIGSAEIDERSILVSTEKQQTLVPERPQKPLRQEMMQEPGLDKGPDDDAPGSKGFDDIVDDLHSD